MNKILILLLFPIMGISQITRNGDEILMTENTLTKINYKLQENEHCKNTLILLQDEIDNYSQNNLKKDSITIFFQKKAFDLQKVNGTLLYQKGEVDAINIKLIEEKKELNSRLKKETIKYNIAKIVCVAGFSFIIGNLLF